MAAIKFGLQEKQQIFWSYLNDNAVTAICYGGSRKSGKSYVGRAASVFRRLAFPGSYGLILRETLPELEANHVEQIKQLCDDWDVKWLYNVNDSIFTFPQFRHGLIPSKIFLGYGRTVDQVRRYQGNPYLDVFYDEATNLIRQVVSYTTGSLANEHWPETTTKEIYTCNPGGVGSQWVRRELVEEETRKKGSVFVPAFVEDNPAFLESDPLFRERLTEEYRDQPWVVAQWLEGNWDASPNSYFALDARKGGRHIRQVEVPYWAKWYAAFDAGYYPDPFAAVWAARWRDVDDKLHVHVVMDYKAWRLEVDEQARKVREIERGIKGMDPRCRRFSDWSTGHRVPSESANVTKTVRDMWRKHGLLTTAARKFGRIDGWMLIRYLLAHNELTMDPACRALIQEFRDAQHEKDGSGQVGNDLDDRTGDHNLDCLRMLVCETVGLRHMKEPVSDWDQVREAA